MLFAFITSIEYYLCTRSNIHVPVGTVSVVRCHSTLENCFHQNMILDVKKKDEGGARKFVHVSWPSQLYVEIPYIRYTRRL
jgi:3-polyprenyl-4-hydroxybenzoate decarboxylase